MQGSDMVGMVLGSITGLIGAVLITWYFSRRYYLKSIVDQQKENRSLKEQITRLREIQDYSLQYRTKEESQIFKSFVSSRQCEKCNSPTRVEGMYWSPNHQKEKYGYDEPYHSCFGICKNKQFENKVG